MLFVLTGGYIAHDTHRRGRLDEATSEEGEMQSRAIAASCHSEKSRGSASVRRRIVLLSSAFALAAAGVALPLLTAQAAQKPQAVDKQAVARGKYLVSRGQLHRLPHPRSFPRQGGCDQIPRRLRCRICHSRAWRVRRPQSDARQGDRPRQLDAGTDRNRIDQGSKRPTAARSRRRCRARTTRI